MIPPVASNFVAGETPAEVIEHTRDINACGVRGILNLLGEHYHERGPADADRDAYLDLVDDLADSRVDACISVKPSQIGLDVDRSVFEENYAAIAERAVERDVFCWLDMEDHTTTDATLDAYEDRARQHGGGLGLCVQANLRRTREDIERLADVPGKLRLVKGAYDEPADVAFEKKEKVNEAYRQHLEYLFREYVGTVGVGSHDPAMIQAAVDLHEDYGTDFEIQMLMGVREQAQSDLAETYDVYQYVPYGDKWLSYFYRRVMERKENIAFAARAVLGS